MTDEPKQLVRRGYDAVSRVYRGDCVDEATERQYRAWVSMLDPILPPGGDVLDLGCGCGLPAARLLAARYNVVGVDISPVQIERARTLVPGATLHCADIASFPLPPASFDGVVSLYALIHLPVAEQPMLIRNIATALRAGGALLMTVGHHAWTGTEADWLGVAGATMFWSHEGEEAYRRWVVEAGMSVRRCEFVPEGQRGHSLILATKP